MTMFSQKVQEELGYYVYCLVDPRDKKIFYIGKGVGNRVFAHACDALEYEDANTDKLEKIREIMKSGYEVEHYIIRHKLTEEDAFTVESVLIDFLTYQEFNTESLLTNIVAGHHQWNEGIKTVDQIMQIYDCEPLLLKPGHKLLMVNLNRRYMKKSEDGMRVNSDLYEITRKYWKVSKHNADQIDYLLGVYKGVVRCVLKPTTEWLPFKHREKDGRVIIRYYVEGVIDDKEGNDLYLNKDVTEYPFPSRGAIRYIRESIDSTNDITSVATIPKTSDTPKKLKTSEFPWDIKLWEPVKAELLKHMKIKVSIPKGRSYMGVPSVANKGNVAVWISYGVRESTACVSMETYGGEEMKGKISAVIASLPGTHPLKHAALLQGKRNKNKWAWSIKHSIDKTDAGLVQWYVDQLLSLCTVMEGMTLS